jgi:hypothetical protein
MNILFYGTCQSGAIKKILNLGNEFTQHHIQCYSTDISKKDFDDIIKICDIIIMQTVPDNYRDKEYLSSNYIIKNCKISCKIIIYQRQYFNFYYYDTLYKQFNGDTLHKPNDYHYGEMINYYKNKKTIEEYNNEIVKNKNLKSKEELEKIANDSIKYLIEKDKEIIRTYVKKDNIKYISIVDFIKDNYKKYLLFYSMNHPTKKLLQLICEKIIEILNIKNTIKYDIDPLNDPKCILYKCIENVVEFKVSDEIPFLKNKTNVIDIAKLYFDVYDEIHL